VEWVEESAMDAATGLSGSGPAFVFHVLDALTVGGDKAGLPKAVAYRLARQTLQGAARLAIETDLTPNEWIEQVKTPGGTTVEGLTVLEEAGVQEAFVEAVASASRRAAKLSENL
ncbi:MAG: pyrroline-5-carboxylate reductase, partial [Acidobacteriia bacterium]|nr:pyrroline-5-carboxylate reductase [Terriglobia bacterium]